MYYSKLYKVFAMGMIIVASLTCVSGCTEFNSAGHKNIPTHSGTMNYGVGSKDLLQNYEQAVVSMEPALPFSETGLVVKYNGEELTFPFELSKLTQDGWMLSDKTYATKGDKVRDYTDAAIYSNKKYGKSELVLSSYKVSGKPGIAGRQDVLSKYGVYSMSLHCGDDVKTYPKLEICGLDIFSASDEAIISTFNNSKIVKSSEYELNGVNTYSYVYDLGTYLVELKLVCKDGQVYQCLFTTTVEARTD